MRAYGTLVRADADRRVMASEIALAEALEALRETRAVLTELLMVNASEAFDQWLLGGSFLLSVDRILRELDLEERARQRERWEAALAARRPPLRSIARPRARRAGIHRRT